MADQELKTFTLWTEGYAATGQQSGAECHGQIQGTDFNDAVRNYVAPLPASISHYWDFHATQNVWTRWGCRAFDNEADARRAFG
jgi:hypothetical protein